VKRFSGERPINRRCLSSVAAAFVLCSSEAGAAPTAAPAPELSGLWARHSVDFEPPASGPGPIANTSRLPDGSRDIDTPVGDYTNPILKPEAAAIVRRRGEVSLSGTNYPTPGNQCWPAGPPFILNQMEIQILQQPDKVIILYLLDHHVRHVYLDVPHRPRAAPSWYGDSVGHYEGDTLVVDTIGIKVGPYAMADDYGTPHSDALHVVERYRLIDGEAAQRTIERHEKENGIVPPEAEGFTVDPDYRGKALQIQFAVEDHSVFTTPWSAAVTYRRAGNLWREHICAENPREGADRLSAVPTAATPDF